MKEPSKGMERQASPCESVQTPVREQRRHESHHEPSKSEAPIRGLKMVLEEKEQCVGDQGKASKMGLWDRGDGYEKTKAQN